MVWAGIVLVPEAKYPEILAGLATATQVKLVPIILEVRFTAVVVFPEHIVSCNGVLVTVGEGSTCIEYTTGVPEQFDGAGPNGVIV
jgi:hypothetical protein